MGCKVGDRITYDTPLSGCGKYEAEILGLESDNVYKVRISKVVKPSHNPIAPQKPGDIDYVILVG